MHSWSDTLRFAFQPIVNLTTGGVSALEILARPETGDVLAQARRDPELDGRLAASAIRAAARRETLLPLHVTVFAATPADLGGLAALRDAVREVGRLPWEVTVDIVPPYTHVPRPALLEAVAALRGEGFRICADGVGDGDVPLRLLVDLGPDLVKLDASLLARPAALLPVTASAGEVRALLTGAPEVSGVLLVDGSGRPVRSVHRSRFLLSLSGRYGHALYADRPAARLGDPPRTVGADATAWEALDVVAVGDRDRTSDDVAVVDRYGRCVGVVRLADLLRALAESRVEEAAGLSPLTRLPGSGAITDEVDRWIADGRAFALSWLDIDHFKQVNDGAGFAAGDELIRSVGWALRHAASGATRVGHIGGDDFLFLAEPDGLGPVARAMLDAPWSAGGRPVTLSLATVVCEPGSVTDHREAAACLAPLKKAAKAVGGASWVLGRAGVPGHEVRRGEVRRGAEAVAVAAAGYGQADPARAE